MINQRRGRNFRDECAIARNLVVSLTVLTICHEMPRVIVHEYGLRITVLESKSRCSKRRWSMCSNRCSNCCSILHGTCHDCEIYIDQRQAVTYREATSLIRERTLHQFWRGRESCSPMTLNPPCFPFYLSLTTKNAVDPTLIRATNTRRLGGKDFFLRESSFFEFQELSDAPIASWLFLLLTHKLVSVRYYRR